MSTHPNVILMTVLTPSDLARRTMWAILEENEVETEDDKIKIGSAEYRHCVMESDYEDSYQISAKKGDLVFFDLVTYGYGEVITWSQLKAKKDDLEVWAKQMAELHSCTYEIRVSANYW